MEKTKVAGVGGLEGEVGELKRELAQKEVEYFKCEEALLNMHSLLDQLQHDQELKTHSEIILLKKEIKSAKEELAQWKNKAEKLEGIERKLDESVNQRNELNTQLTLKTKQLLMIQEQIQPLKRALEESAKQLASSSRKEVDMVDKRIVTNLFITYLEAKTKPEDLVALMERILNFNEKEKNHIWDLLRKSQSWSFGIFGGGEIKPSLTEAQLDKSLSDLWVDFLIKEAEQTPARPIPQSPSSKEQFTPNLKNQQQQQHQQEIQMTPLSPLRTSNSQSSLPQFQSNSQSSLSLNEFSNTTTTTATAIPHTPISNSTFSHLPQQTPDKQNQNSQEFV